MSISGIGNTPPLLGFEPNQPQKMHAMAFAVLSHAAQAVAAITNTQDENDATSNSIMVIGDLAALDSLLLQLKSDPNNAKLKNLIQKYVQALQNYDNSGAALDPNIKTMLDGMVKNFDGQGNVIDPAKFRNDWVQPTSSTAVGGMEIALKFLGNLSNYNPSSANPLVMTNLFVFLSDTFLNPTVTQQTYYYPPGSGHEVSYDQYIWGSKWGPIPFSDLFSYVTAVGFYGSDIGMFNSNLANLYQVLPSTALIDTMYPSGHAPDLSNYTATLSNFQQMMTYFSSPNPSFPPQSWIDKYPFLQSELPAPSPFGTPADFSNFYQYVEGQAWHHFFS